MTLIEDTVGMKFHFDEVLYIIHDVWPQGEEYFVQGKSENGKHPGTFTTWGWGELVKKNTKIYNKNDNPEMFL